MTNYEFQKQFSEAWKGYGGDPDIKTIELRYKKMRDEVYAEGSGKKILDIGCADGALAAPLLERYEILGVDASDYLCARALERGIKVTQADIEEGISFDRDILRSTYPAVLPQGTIEGKG